MNRPQRSLFIGGVAAVAAVAGITWVAASGGVVLYPATIAFSLSLPAEPASQISVRAESATGDLWFSRSVPAGGAGPHSIDLTVEGGNPSATEPAGVSYRTSVMVELVSSPTVSTFLEVGRASPVPVANTPATPSVTVPVSFSYPTTYRVNASISVAGGTLGSYQIYANGGDPATTEQYRGCTLGYADSQSSIGIWVPMIPQSSVAVHGIVDVRDSHGVWSQRFLEMQDVDLTIGNADVSWAIDVTDSLAGTLEGDITLGATSGSAATPTSYEIHYRGTSPSTWMISGLLEVSPTSPHYSIALKPGTYNVRLKTVFSDWVQDSESPATSVTIVADATTDLDFNSTFGVARIALDVTGFYDKSSLEFAKSSLRGSAGNFARSHDLATATATVDHTVPVGDWQLGGIGLSIFDQSNPDLSNTSYIYRSYYDVTATPLVSVVASGVAPLGTESFTLVKSNVYFDVLEPKGQPPMYVSSPEIMSYKDERNSDNSLRSRFQVQAFGTDVPQQRPGLTVVAEPGMYRLIANANVNGTQTQFTGSTMWFGEPVETPIGSSAVILTPEQNPDLRVSLVFDDVDSGGITTVVETPLGPEPPEGFRAICVPDPNMPDETSCAPVYYDITSNAVWNQNGNGATVCIRRLFQPPQVMTGLAADFLSLWHYGPDGWEELPERVATDCAVDPAACQCPGNPADCNVPADSFLFQVCGRTTSFSPYGLFQGKTFTNEVDGVTYTGPNGPPTLQRWKVPGTGTYEITAIGAQGGSGTNSPSLKGGCGAEVTGELTLQAGEIIEILVGQKGTASPHSGGGGGGTFVIKNGAPLLIAGGGGGVRAGAVVPGRPGTLSSSGTAGSTSSNYSTGFVSGGTHGAGGLRTLSYGSGGGGWSGNGASDGTYGEGGFAFLSANRAKGGAGKSCGALAHGGYGGGGAGNGCYGGGGGGGYSGGGGGRVGGGGGSLNNGANPSGHEGICTLTGHGSVTIVLADP